MPAAAFHIGAIPLLPAEFRLNILAQRTLILALMLGTEALIASVWLDGDTLARINLGHNGGALAGLLAGWGAWTVKAIVGFAALFTTFAYLKHQAALSRLSGTISESPIRPLFLAAHFGMLARFAFLSALLYGSLATTLPLNWIAAAWTIAALSAVLLLGLALAPVTFWPDLLRRTGNQ